MDRSIWEVLGGGREIGVDEGSEYVCRCLTSFRFHSSYTYARVVCFADLRSICDRIVSTFSAAVLRILLLFSYLDLEGLP